MHEPTGIARGATGSVSAQLLAELECAYDEVKIYTGELALLLDLPQPDRTRLTTVRLKLARLRLVQGATIGRIYRHLIAKADEAEQDKLREMHSDHSRLLNAASVHTTRWTIDAIEADWPGYQSATQAIVRLGLEKMNAEHQKLQSLLKKDA